MSINLQSLQIRDAEISDCADIVRIYNQCVLTSTSVFDLQEQSVESRAAWLAENRAAGHPTLILEKDSSLIAWAALSPYQNRCGFRACMEASIYLDENYRKQGIGRHLMAHLMTAANKKEYHAILAFICSENHTAVKLTEEFGFCLVGQLKEVGYKFGRWLDVSILEKVL